MKIIVIKENLENYRRQDEMGNYSTNKNLRAQKIRWLDKLLKYKTNQVSTNSSK